MSKENQDRRTNHHRVFVHTRKHGQFNWGNTFHEFSRVPTVGEYITLASSDNWHAVKLVVHTPFDDAECVAEVYAVAVDQTDAMKRAMSDAPWPASNENG